VSRRSPPAAVGTSSTFTFNDPASGAAITTKLNVRTLSLLYAITYQF
jgi:hypothetical protein